MARSLSRTVRLTRREFDELPEYSASVPTGTTIGKRWKRRVGPHEGPPTWQMGEYQEDSDPDKVRIAWSTIVLAPLAGQGSGVIKMDAPRTLCDPKQEDIAEEWERMGGLPIKGSKILERIGQDIHFWPGGHLASGLMRISWHRMNERKYVTVERVKERDSA